QLHRYRWPKRGWKQNADCSALFNLIMRIIYICPILLILCNEYLNFSTRCLVRRISC
ncbi:hypothetical protein L9F63_008234, partial [Diploptera punctata]